MKTWVVKIGTSILRGTDETSTEEIIESLCKPLTKFILKGNKVVLVTSGAVGLGCKKLKLRTRPTELSTLQAAAAVGQVNLMTLYEKTMRNLGHNIAQILITKADFNSRESFNNASKTFKKLIDMNVVPIVNENDSVANEELKYGDNDTLSALVAIAINANKLILLTDIENLYSKDPRNNKDAHPIREVNNSELKKIQDKNNKNYTNEWGTGGITTKLIAAEIATKGGVEVQLADGRNEKNLVNIFDDKKVGTIFHPLDKPIRNKKSWLSHAIQTVGQITLDEGAYHAIKKKGASLLIVGVKKVEGHFTINQAVKIVTTNKKEVAKGITSMSSDSLKSFLKEKEKCNPSMIVIHRDVLALS